jgi:hypothetical protein
MKRVNCCAEVVLGLEDSTLQSPTTSRNQPMRYKTCSVPQPRMAHETNTHSSQADPGRHIPYRYRHHRRLCRSGRLGNEDGHAGHLLLRMRSRLRLPSLREDVRNPQVRKPLVGPVLPQARPCRRAGSYSDAAPIALSPPKPRPSRLVPDFRDRERPTAA